MRDGIDQQAGKAHTRQHFQFWLDHCQGLRTLPPRGVVRVAASLEEHATSDMLWRVIAELRGLALEPADDFISVMALVGARDKVEDAPEYMAAVEQLATAAGENLDVFKAEYHKRVHLVRSRASSGSALRPPAQKLKGKGLKSAPTTQGWRRRSPHPKPRRRRAFCGAALAPASRRGSTS